MHRRRLSIASACVFWASVLTGSAEAQVYKYRTKDGTVAYTDSLAKLPPKRRAYYNKLEQEAKERRRRLEKAVGKEKLAREEKEAERRRVLNAQIDEEERQRRLSAIDAQLKAIRTRRATREASRSEWKQRVKAARDGLRDKIAAFRAAKKDYGSVAIKGGYGLLPGEQKKMDDAKVKMQDLEKEIDALNTELTVTIPEDARKAGVPPGWIR